MECPHIAGHYSNELLIVGTGIIEEMISEDCDWSQIDRRIPVARETIPKSHAKRLAYNCTPLARTRTYLFPTTMASKQLKHFSRDEVSKVAYLLSFSGNLVLNQAHI